MERLRELSKKNGPLCVGLDTDPSYIPESVLRRFGGKAEAVFAYNREIINRIAADKSACCCKVQIAYYEATGIAGMIAYAKTLSAVREAGLSVISDIKRGDIANTAEAYARAHFSGDFETDIATVNPYMGFDTLSPFVDFCKKGKGIFVLLRTSNPGAADIIDHTQLFFPLSGINRLYVLVCGNDCKNLFPVRIERKSILNISHLYIEKACVDIP